MKSRTDYPQIDYRTQLQWAKAGKIVNSDAIGVRMWSNGHRQRAFIYFGPCDVHDGTDEELKIYFAPIRARQRNQRIAAQRRQLEKAQQEHEQQIKDAKIEANHLLIRSFLSNIAARSRVPPVSPRKRVIVLDTETTGLGSLDEILQISIIDGNGNILLDTLVHPYYHSTWPDAEKVHGITPDMVADAPYPHELLPTIQAIFSETLLLIGYNTNFDLGFLQNWGIHPFNIQVVDVMQEFADYYSVHDDPYDGRRYYKLAFCADYFGFTWPGAAHNSLHDAMATLHCYKKMAVD